MMEENILVLYDREEEYTQLMTDFLKMHRDAPWEIHAYTMEEELLKQEQRTKISMLVIAESSYSESCAILQADKKVILNESGVVRWGNLPNINKYQRAEDVLKELLELYMDVAKGVLPKLHNSFQTHFIGIYSPIKRCLQTSVALSMCQMLAGKHRTLYLNFQHYSGIAELLPDRQSRDMADLLYFLNTEQEKFRLRLQTIIQHKGSLEYIPPMKSGQNLLTITAAEWLQLLQKIEELGEYKYIVLDLSESMQGLFDILRICGKIFTLTEEDRVSKTKLMQYEQLLEWYDYEDVLQKTSRYGSPRIRRFPAELEQYTRGELAEFVRALVEELTDD